MTSLNRFVKGNGIEIATTSYGDISHPALILVMGATASMDWWDEDFCSLLASTGFHVIKYDNRDVGQTTTCPPGLINYTISHMVDDLMTVAGAYSLQTFHVMGLSLGGMIAQLAAIKFPERIASLTLCGTSVWDDLPHLPPIRPEIINFLQESTRIDWEKPDCIINYIIESWRILSGSGHTFNTERVKSCAESELARSINIQSRFNHGLLGGCEELYGKSSLISSPAIILHGDEDPVFPIEHAHELQKTIADSTLHIMQKTGHELPENEWKTIADLMKCHLKISIERILKSN
jgi:pimeloyl-ACP methyl ester carboxylesterase